MRKWEEGGCAKWGSSAWDWSWVEDSVREKVRKKFEEEELE